jgi:hypothetical protein
LLIGVILVACDSGDDPRPVSRFLPEDTYSRQIVGRVLAGTEPVPGALVHVDPTPGYASDETLTAKIGDAGDFGRTVPTDAAGAYRFQFAPFVYDLSIRHERELLAFRGLAVRAFDAPLAVEASPAGFHATVVPSTDPPPKAGNAIAYFVSGAEARASAEPQSGAPGWHDVTFRHFDSTITLHAIEYDAARGPAAAVAEGRLTVRVQQGTVVSPVVPMTPLSTTLRVVFEATPPAGYALAPLEVEMDLGLRTSTVPVARLEPGVPIDITIAKDARYLVHARATLGGAVSDSGRHLFNSYEGKIALTLPGPVTSEAPIDDRTPPLPSSPATLDAAGILAASIDKGVVEHALAPESGDGTSVRVATSSRATTLPDVAALGLPRPTGRYVWTLQHFPMLPHIDNLAGEDGRITQPSWRSAPRTIVLR